jgi:hypothetical protein
MSQPKAMQPFPPREYIEYMGGTYRSKRWLISQIGNILTRQQDLQIANISSSGCTISIDNNTAYRDFLHIEFFRVRRLFSKGLRGDLSTSVRRLFVILGLVGLIVDIFPGSLLLTVDLQERGPVECQFQEDRSLSLQIMPCRLTRNLW